MRRGILSHCLRIFLICWAIGTFYIIFEEVVPVTRTYFWNYQAFRKRADFTTYPKELPASAHNMKYYYYEGFLADKSGYHVSYFREDYELMREKRLESYNPDFPWEVYCYNGGEKLYLDCEKMKEKRIDFLDILMPEETDISQYYLLAYDLFEDDQVYSYAGIFCNDETCEMIEFSCRCPN
ncbi:MAG: hypothetical protein K2N81_10550 [Acetatifactor sp.]|nr:hypothetical protein [Acetatifactor sp.]